MGKPDQTNTGTIVAVIVVGLLLLVVVIGGAAVLLGGLLWFSYESAPQQVMVSPQAVTSAEVPVQTQPIEIDESGEITFATESVTPDELRLRLEEIQQQSGDVTPMLSAHPDCPDDVRAEVISVCEEVFGIGPQIISEPTTEPVAPTQPVVSEESQ